LDNNDLKYRYVKSLNPNNEFIQHLEKIFGYGRDRKEIRNICRKVKRYEKIGNSKEFRTKSTKYYFLSDTFVIFAK